MTPKTIGPAGCAEHLNEWFSIPEPASAYGLSVPANNLKATNMELYKRKAPSIDFNKTKIIRFKPLPKSDLSPTSYKPDLATKITKPKSIALSVPKEKLKTFVTRH